MIDLTSLLSTVAAPLAPRVAAGSADASAAPGSFEQTLEAFLDSHDAASDRQGVPTATGDRQALADDGKDLPAEADADGDSPDAAATPAWLSSLLTPPFPPAATPPPPTPATAFAPASAATSVATTPTAQLTASALPPLVADRIPVSTEQVASAPTAATDLLTLATAATPSTRTPLATSAASLVSGIAPAPTDARVATVWASTAASPDTVGPQQTVIASAGRHGATRAGADSSAALATDLTPGAHIQSATTRPTSPAPSAAPEPYASPVCLASAAPAPQDTTLVAVTPDVQAVAPSAAPLAPAAAWSDAVTALAPPSTTPPAVMVSALLPSIPASPGAVAPVTPAPAPRPVAQAPASAADTIPPATPPLPSAAATRVVLASMALDQAAQPVSVDAAAPAVGPVSDALPGNAAVAPANIAASAPNFTVGVAPQPAGQVFAAAIAAASNWRDRAARSPATDPVDAGAALGITAQAHRNEPNAVQAAADTSHAALDLTQDSGLQRMIDRIETLRDDVGDAADSRDTRIRLVPDALGSVDVAVRQVGDRVHVHFTAEQDATRALIAEAQPRLTELAAARGVRIGDTTASTDSSGGNNGAAPQPRPAPQIPHAPRAATDTETSSDARVA